MNWETILANTKEIVSGLTSFLISAVAFFIGVLFVFSGISKILAYSKGERQGQPTGGPVAINLVVGSFLLQLSFTVGVLMDSVFGEKPSKPNEVLAYMPSQVSNSEFLKQMVETAAWWVYAIGYIAVIRGFVLWNELANGSRGSTDRAGWRGVWHIFFGALAINLPGTLKWFKS